MSRATDKDVESGESPKREPVGKVEFDARGKAVWRWACDVLESTSVLLKRLENRDLKLEPTRKLPVLGKAEPAKPRARAGGRVPPAANDDAAPRHPAARSGARRDGGGGFDPYNSR
jgi:hypothetical protein